LRLGGLFEQFIPFSPYLALFLRVVVGATLIMHGYPKLKNPKQTVQWTKGLGVPAVATYLVIILEFFGGIALIIGLIVPVVAFFIALEMVGNIILKKTKMKGESCSIRARCALPAPSNYSHSARGRGILT
jgi:uncharacterized membrane protein YphA (DoxX/SURF4 family)